VSRAGGWAGCGRRQGSNCPLVALFSISAVNLQYFITSLGRFGKLIRGCRQTAEEYEVLKEYTVFKGRPVWPHGHRVRGLIDRVFPDGNSYEVAFKIEVIEKSGEVTSPHPAGFGRARPPQRHIEQDHRPDMESCEGVGTHKGRPHKRSDAELGTHKSALTRNRART